MNLTFVHNILNKKIPNTFQNFIKTYKVNHSYRTTRNASSNYSMPEGSVVASVSGTNKTNVALSETCALIWNRYLKFLTFDKLSQKKPTDILEPNWLQNMSIKELKNTFKKYILATYQ